MFHTAELSEVEAPLNTSLTGSEVTKFGKLKSTVFVVSISNLSPNHLLPTKARLYSSTS